ncbi:hypothetical protein ACB094_01G013600 [Castanea mollissima]
MEWEEFSRRVCDVRLSRNGFGMEDAFEVEVVRDELGTASALETLCGQAYGARQYHMFGIYLQRSWIVLFSCSILLLPLFLFAMPMLKLMGQTDAVAEQLGLVAMWLIPMHLMKTWVLAYISGGALALHVFVSWFFVYKLRVGIVGAALTLDFSWWVSVLGLFVYVVCGGCADSWTGFSGQAFVGLWEFFKRSVASGVMIALENFYYRVFIIVSGYLHNTEVAVDALSICLFLTIFSMLRCFGGITIFGWESMIPLGFLAASGVRVANELGASNAKGAKFATTISMLSSLMVGLLFWSIIIAFPENLAMIFTSSASVIEMVNDLAVLLAFTILYNCIQPVLSGGAIGSGWQAKGIWTGMISGTVVQTLILAVITLRCEWEKEAQKVQLLITKEAASRH